MANDFETNWLPLRMEGAQTFGGAREAASLQIYWSEADGTLDGTIDVYLTNDQNGKSLAGSYTVDCAENKDDAILIELSQSCEYLKILYTKNGVTDGYLNAVLSYKKVG